MGSYVSTWQETLGLGLCLNLPNVQSKPCLQKPHPDVTVLARLTHLGPHGQMPTHL